MHVGFFVELVNKPYWNTLLSSAIGLCNTLSKLHTKLSAQVNGNICSFKHHRLRSYPQGTEIPNNFSHAEEILSAPVMARKGSRFQTG